MEGSAAQEHWSAPRFSDRRCLLFFWINRQAGENSENVIHPVGAASGRATTGDPSSEATIDYGTLSNSAISRALRDCRRASECPQIDQLSKHDFRAYCVQSQGCTTRVSFAEANGAPPVPRPKASVAESVPRNSTSTRGVAADDDPGAEPIPGDGYVDQLQPSPDYQYYYLWHKNQAIRYFICGFDTCDEVGTARLGVQVELNGRYADRGFQMSIDPSSGPDIDSTFYYRCTRFLAGNPGCNTSWNTLKDYPCPYFTSDKCEMPWDSWGGHPNGTYTWLHRWSWAASGYPGIVWNIPYPGEAETEYYSCSSSPNDCHYTF